MNVENVPLDIRQILERKKVDYKKHDVARMRYLCKTFIEFVVDMGK